MFDEMDVFSMIDMENDVRLRQFKKEVAKCSRLELHNLRNTLPKTKCKDCKKTVEQIVKSEKNVQ